MEVPTDYTGNSKSQRQPKGRQEKNIERVIDTTVVVKKKSLGRRFRDLLIEADFRGVVKYVVSDVLLPAARNTIVDASTRGIERMMYGDRASTRGRASVGSRITYNRPVNRGGYSESRYAPSVSPDPRTPRGGRDDIILSTRQDAELVLERLNDIIDNYEVASVGDLNELVGLAVTPIDNKWGWIYLGDVQVRQVREGYLLDLPPAEALQ